jgi:hypothetical protein
MKGSNMKAFLISSAAALALFAVPAAAAPGEGRDGMRADSNGDGQVSRAEAQAASDTRFAKMDANGDGKLDATDRAAMAEKRGGEGKRKGGKRGDHRERGGPGGPGGGRGGPMLDLADTNNDKAISRDEFRTASLTMFTRADANKDGVVTAAEQQAARAKMRERMREGRPE